MKVSSPAEGCIYLCFLFRSSGFCCKKILRLCQRCCYKIRPPYCHPKVSICRNLPIPRRCRSQPLSGVSRKQRYNTLDFASKIVCQNGRCPLWIPLPRATPFPFGCPLPTGRSRPYWMTPSQRGFRPLWKLPLFSALLLLLEFVYTNSQKYKKATQPIYEN